MIKISNMNNKDFVKTNDSFSTLVKSQPTIGQCNN